MFIVTPKDSESFRPANSHKNLEFAERKIYFFSQQKSVPFGKGGGSQYGLTSPG